MRHHFLIPPIPTKVINNVTSHRCLSVDAHATTPLHTFKRQYTSSDPCCLTSSVHYSLRSQKPQRCKHLSHSSLAPNNHESHPQSPHKDPKTLDDKHPQQHTHTTLPQNGQARQPPQSLHTRYHSKRAEKPLYHRSETSDPARRTQGPQRLETCFDSVVHGICASQALARSETRSSGYLVKI